MIFLITIIYFTEFVNDNVAKKKYCLTSQQYRQTLTMLCATLRNPKPSTSRDTQKKMYTAQKGMQESMSIKNGCDKPESKDLEESDAGGLNTNEENISEQSQTSNSKGKRDEQTKQASFRERERTEPNSEERMKTEQVQNVKKNKRKFESVDNSKKRQKK